jgi:hypothetical protein
MADCLPRAIAFFHSQLVSRAFTPGGDDPSEKFLVRCLLALRNTLSTSAYLPTARAAPQAHTCHQALAALSNTNPLHNLAVGDHVTQTQTQTLTLAARAGQALAAFFSSSALAQLCRALLTRALVLSPAELAEYDDDPEGFVHEESVARETEGLRKCAACNRAACCLLPAACCLLPAA